MNDKLLYGWIIAYETEKKDLEDLGVKVGEYCKSGGCFEDCEVDVKTMDKLKPLWGRYFWGLHTDDGKRIGFDGRGIH